MTSVEAVVASRRSLCAVVPSRSALHRAAVRFPRARHFPGPGGQKDYKTQRSAKYRRPDRHAMKINMLPHKRSGHVLDPRSSTGAARSAPPGRSRALAPVPPPLRTPTYRVQAPHTTHHSIVLSRPLPHHPTRQTDLPLQRPTLKFVNTDDKCVQTYAHAGTSRG